MPPRLPHRLGRVAPASAAVAVLVLLAAACSGDDGGAGPTTQPLATAAPTTTSAGVVPTTVPSDGATTVPGDAPSTVGPVSTPGPTIGPTTQPPTSPAPPPTGLPGFDSDDPFCRDDATVLGSANLIGIASAFSGQSEADLLLAEVVAAPSMVDAAGRIAGEVPAVAEADQQVLVEQSIAPVLARAQSVLAALVAAGVDEAGRRELASAWAEVLATDDQADPGIIVPPLDEDLAEQVATAVAALQGTLPPYLQDPSLATVGAPTPLLDQYLAETCPEVLGLVGGDAV